MIKNISILHSAITHIEDIKFLEAADFGGFCSMQRVVSKFVQENYVLHHRMQIVFDKYKAISHYYLIRPTLTIKRIV